MEAPFHARAGCSDILSELFLRPSGLWESALVFLQNPLGPSKKSLALKFKFLDVLWAEAEPGLSGTP